MRLLLYSFTKYYCRFVYTRHVYCRITVNPVSLNTVVLYNLVKKMVTMGWN